MKKRNGIMTFRLPVEEKDKLSSYLEVLDCTLSDLAVKAVRDLLAKLDAEQATAPTPKAPKAPTKKKKA